MPKNLSPEVAAQLESSRVVSVPGLRDTIAAIQGTAQMGPLTPVECNSWEDFVKYFGGDDADATLPNQIRMLYKQDRSATVLVHRVVHYSDLVAPTKTSVAASVDIPSQATAATAGSVTGTVAGFAVAGGDVAWRVADADTLIVHCDADVGGPDTLTITANPASLTGGATSLPCSSGDTITFTCDKVPGTQVVTFSGNHATIEAAAQDINAQVAGFKAIVVGGATVDFTSDTLGNDSTIAITAGTGTALADIGHSVSSDTEAASNVGDVFAVTYTEWKALIEATVVNPVTGVTVSLASGNYLKITSNTTGASSSIEITAASTADDELGLDNVLHSGSAASSVTTIVADGKYDGDYAHDLRIIIENASNGDATYFNMRVTDDEGNFKEIFPDLQVATDTDDDFVETVVNREPDYGGSRYFTVTDQAVTIRPANGTYTPSGGDDGLTGLVDTDFIGDKSGATGLYAYDNIQELTLLVDGGRATAAYANGMIAYAQTERDGWCGVICDPPASQTAANIVAYAATLPAAQQAFLYWCRIKILNPSKTIYGNTEQLTIAPSGAIAGIFSRRASEQLGGIHKAPAGIPFQGLLRGQIVGCQALETDDVLDKAKRDVVYPKRVNPLNFGGGTYYVDGSRGLDAQGQFPTVGEWMGTVFIVRSLLAGFEFAKHMANDEDLWALMRRTGRLFLLGQMRLGAFKSKTDEAQAFFIEVNEALNPPSVVEQEKVYFRIGLAKSKPASFVNLLVSKDTRALEDEISG